LSKNISILGLGLIGGSIAKALKSSDPSIRINGFDKETVLNKAFKENNINFKLKKIEDAKDSDLIFICLPTETSLEILEALAPIISEKTIITDVCGVKSVFESTWNKLNSRGEYIGGHPMTGKEKGGYENSDPLLFENSVYILTERKSENSSYNFLIDTIKMLGARIKFLDPYLHDEIVAKVSHLPQLVSVALVNSVTNNDKINYLDFAAGGFRDMTRIASSEFSIWAPVIKFNKDAIVKGVLKFASELAEIDNIILKEDHAALQHLFDNARKGRDEIPKNTKGFINPLFDIFVFVKDEPGVLSKLTTELFNNKINIKDIELLKIREGTGGTFRLSFESGADAEKAREVIEKSGFKTK
jgi:prephenate dehydrogenase